MKILQVITSFPPAYAYGGPVESSYNISKELVNRGHSVSVFTTDVKNSRSRVKGYSNPEFREGIRIYRYKNISNRLAWSANISSAIGMWSGLRSKVGDFDVVHLHEYRSPEAAIASYEASRQGTPIILQPRGSVPRSTKNTQKMIFDKLFGEGIIDSANRIVASSRVESKQYTGAVKGISEKDISHIPNGFSKSEYRHLPNKGEFREEYGISESTAIVMFLGRIHSIKGIDNLIRAFSKIDGSRDAILTIVGPDDGDKPRLERLQKKLGCEDVIYTGPIFGKSKLGAYLDADVFVLPSNYESFGNVAIEAMACGTPTITTESCGVSEWLDHEGNQTVTGNPSALRDAIITAIDRDLPSRESIRRYIWNNFTWEPVAHNTENLYWEVVV